MRLHATSILLPLVIAGRTCPVAGETRLPPQPNPLALKYVGTGFTVGSWRPDAVTAQKLERLSRDLYDASGLLEDPPARGEKLAQLRRELERTLALSRGRSARAHHLLASVAFLDGRRAEAIRHAARAASLHPGSSRYLSNLAFHLQADGRDADAERLYRDARRLDPRNTACHLGLISLAPRRPSLKAAELASVAEDWIRRETDASLLELARTLKEVLEILRELEAEDSTAGEADIRELRAAIGEVLRP